MIIFKNIALIQMARDSPIDNTGIVVLLDHFAATRSTTNVHKEQFTGGCVEPSVSKFLLIAVFRVNSVIHVGQLAQKNSTGQEVMQFVLVGSHKFNGGISCSYRQKMSTLLNRRSWVLYPTLKYL